jgi:hypothetical protein
MAQLIFRLRQQYLSEPERLLHLQPSAESPREQKVTVPTINYLANHISLASQPAKEHRAESGPNAGKQPAGPALDLSYLNPLERGQAFSDCPDL